MTLEGSATAKTSLEQHPRAVTLVLLLVSVFVAAALAELTLRVAWPQQVAAIEYAIDPLLGVVRAPHLDGRDSWPGVYDFRYTTNSVGMRGSKEYTEGRAERQRVLLLGDSFTYGIGVDDDHTFAAVLQGLLDRATAAKWEVINAGQPGKGTDYALRFFDIRGRRFRPDVVVLCVNQTDLNDNLNGEYFDVGADGLLAPRDVLSGISERTRAIIEYRHYYSWFTDSTHLGGLMKARLKHWAVRSKPGPRFASRDESLIAGVKPTERYVVELRDEVERSGARFAMLFIAIEKDFDVTQRNGTSGSPERSFERIAEKLGLSYASATKPLIDRSSEGPLYFVEGHLTQLGNQVVADTLLKLLPSQP